MCAHELSLKCKPELNFLDRNLFLVFLIREQINITHAVANSKLEPNCANLSGIKLINMSYNELWKMHELIH